MITQTHVVKEADGTIYQEAGAMYSLGEEPLYRFRLWRTWDGSKPIALFCMLNPSTATHLKLDPTLTRCKGFALAWGMGGFEVINLFAFRATKPKDMKAARDPIGPGNDDLTIARARIVTEAGGTLICGWGQHGLMMERGPDFRMKLRARQIRAHYLRMGAKNCPWHPLYLPADLKPTEWS